MNLVITLLLSVVLLATLGWATHACQERGGPTLERLFRCWRAMVVAGLLLVSAFVLNYFLCSTGLQRSMGSEKLAKDPVLRLVTQGSGLRSNNLFALVIVGFSFLSGAYWLTCLDRVLEAVRSRAWRQDSLAFGLLCLKAAFSSAVLVIALNFDRTLMAFRTATMMYPDELATIPSELPDVFRIISKKSGTMGAWILKALLWFYPVLILFTELHFASCLANFHEASRQHVAARAQATAPPQVPVLPQFQVPNHAGPQAPAPGGAAPWIRPIPFNPGARDDGRRQQEEVDV